MNVPLSLESAGPRTRVRVWLAWAVTAALVALTIAVWLWLLAAAW